MVTFTVHSHVGEDGILHLQVPVGVQDTDLEVVLIVQPKSSENVVKDLSWSSEFFEQIVGGWQGLPLVRESQGEYTL